MTKVFICHASEDKPVVEPIQLALAGIGCKVFYDEQSLPPGGDYHSRIETAIARCDVFVFVASKASLASGKYTLSELGLAHRRWPSPANRVIPVAIQGTRPTELPAYLQAVTVLEVKGNAAAEVRIAVVAVLRARSRRLTLATAGLGLIAVATVFSIPAIRRGFTPSPHLPMSPSVSSEDPSSRPPTPASAAHSPQAALPIASSSSAHPSQRIPVAIVAAPDGMSERQTQNFLYAPLNERTMPKRIKRAGTFGANEEMLKLIHWLDVEQSERYRMSADSTKANIYAADLAYLSGAYFPRIWWTKQSLSQMAAGNVQAPVLGETVREMTANDMCQWLHEYGAQFEWREVQSAEKLQNWANAGATSVICARRVEADRAGHIAKVAPESKQITAITAGADFLPVITQAGAKNINTAASATAWWNAPHFSSSFWYHK